MSPLPSLHADATPARPGPGPLPDALLRALDVAIGRRVEGLLSGDYRSTFLGTGTELAQVRPYEPGDDVRQMDWNVTARTGEPHVRVQLAERVLVTWLVLDTSPSMQFGTADRRKADVAEGVAIAIGHVATRRGNRLGFITFGDATPRALPPRQGRLGLLGLLAALRQEAVVEPESRVRAWTAVGRGVDRSVQTDARQAARPEGRRSDERLGGTSLAEALCRTGALARQRAAVVVVSDFRGPRDWRRDLLAVAGRHDVVAVEVRDPREEELPDAGTLWLVDPETGRQLRVDTRSAKLRARFAAAAAAERRELARTLAGAGVRHVVLSTSGEWLRPLAVFLRRGAAR